MSERATVETLSEEETRALGAQIGAAARPGDVLLLLGTFGVGKTTLVQGIARGMGIEDVVTSPSFVIANEYYGRLPLYHVDLYRVEQMDPTTLETLAEYFGSDGLCAVEWPASVPASLIEDAAQITLEVTGEQNRRLTYEGPAHLREVFEARAVGAPRRRSA
jgi:tRNA threonylcarbamoyladenosine biosynthesis protein TsaE